MIWCQAKSMPPPSSLNTHKQRSARCRRERRGDATRRRQRLAACLGGWKQHRKDTANSRSGSRSESLVLFGSRSERTVVRLHCRLPSGHFGWTRFRISGHPLRNGAHKDYFAIYRISGAARHSWSVWKRSANRGAITI